MPAPHTQLQHQLKRNWFLGFALWVRRFEHLLALHGYDECDGLLDLLLEYELSLEEARIAEQREGALAWARGGLGAGARARYGAYVEYFEAIQSLADQARSCISMAFVKYQQGNPTEAREWLDRAMETGDAIVSQSTLRSLETCLNNPAGSWLEEAQRHFALFTPAEEYLSCALAQGTWAERERVVAALVELQCVDPLIQALDSSEDALRIHAVRGLEQLTPRLPSEQVVSVLVKALQDRHWFVRWRGAAAMATIRDKLDPTPLVNTLADRDPDVRGQAARTLGTRREKQAINELIGALADTDPYVRSITAESLGHLGQAKAIDALLAMMNDPDLYVRCKVIKALGLLKACQAQGQLLDLVEENTSLELRLEAIYALGQMADQKVAEKLDSLALYLSGIDNTSRQLRKALRQAAAQAKARLEKLTSTDEVAAHIRLLDDTSPSGTNIANSDHRDVESQIRLLS
jgi:HEAT repeat protein